MEKRRQRESRREFLGKAGGAVIASWAATRGSAHGEERKTRVAVIGRTGKGDYGHDIDRVWLGVPGVEVVAVADEDAAGREAAARRLGVKATYADFRAMLEKEKPDIVSVAPRWLDQHCEMVEACAGAGAHILTEKPLCRDLLEADRMVAACRKAGVKLAIAHQTRHSPRLKVVQGLIESGEIGQVLELRGRGKEDARRGGGEDLWVLGTHVLDLMRLLAGEPRWCFASVTQGGRPIVAADVVDGNEGLGPLAGDRVEALWGLDSGVTAHFSSRRGAQADPSRFGLSIFGTKGIIEITSPGYLPAVKLLRDPSWSPGRTGKEWLDVSSAGVGRPEPLEDGGLLAGNTLVARDLLAAIAEGREPLGGLRDGVAATEMIIACFASQVAGGPVRLPLERRDHPLGRLRGEG